MLLVALVLFRQDLFQPLCLLFCDPLIYRFWVVADEELLAAAVTPERSHLLEAYGFLAATLFYRHCLHVLILDYLAILLATTFMVILLALCKRMGKELNAQASRPLLRGIPRWLRCRPPPGSRQSTWRRRGRAARMGICHTYFSTDVRQRWWHDGD